jgi:hypothetical protein
MDTLSAEWFRLRLLLRLPLSFQSNFPCLDTRASAPSAPSCPRVCSRYSARQCNFFSVKRREAIYFG